MVDLRAHVSESQNSHYGGGGGPDPYPLLAVVDLLNSPDPWGIFLPPDPPDAFFCPVFLGHSGAGGPAEFS